MKRTPGKGTILKLGVPLSPAEQNARTLRFVCILSGMQQDAMPKLRDEVRGLKLVNFNRGGQSYKSKKNRQCAYELAGRYYRRLLRHNPEYFPGKAATAVHKHCMESKRYYPDRPGDRIPVQKSILRFLKANKSRLIA